LKVDLPPGALGGTTDISVRERASPGEGEVGVVYEIGPTGTRFSSPVTLTIAYSPDDLAGRPEDQLKIATFANGSWQALADNLVDTKNHSVSGTTMHLSPYADVIIPPDQDAGATATGTGGAPNTMPMVGQGGMGMLMPMPAADAGVSRGGDGGSTGAMDQGSGGTTTTSRGGDGNSSMGGGGTAGVDSGSAGSPASGGAPNVGGMSGSAGTGTGVGGGSAGAAGASGGACFADGGTGPAGGPYPTCEAAMPCSGFPNTVMRDCMDLGTGYMATCCPTMDPTGAGGSAGAGGTMGGGSAGTGTSAGGGSGGVACFGDGAAGPPGGPYPTCASAEVCSAYPGAVIQDCVDTPDGYKATCCPSGMVGGGGAPAGGAPNGGTAGAPGAGGASGGTGTCIGVGAAGPPGGPYPSCETSNPCVDYPGAILQDCIDSPEGYKATCCSSSIDPGGGGAGGATGGGGAPMGGATGGGGAPMGGATGGGGAPMGGATGGGAPPGMCIGVGATGPQGGPYPTCETSDPCAAYPGSMLSGCVDTPNGYKGMCCAPGGAPGTGGAPAGGATGGGGTAGGAGAMGSGGTAGGAGAPAGGAPAGSCVPDNPSGACATACSQFPGTMVSGCVDTPPAGHKAMCCMP
jgi:hypothetical protein